MDDEEEARPSGNGKSQPFNAPRNAVGSSYSAAPQAAPAPRDRQSLDGETIFAVGEDGDKWSDDEDSPRSSHERKGFTH